MYYNYNIIGIEGCPDPCDCSGNGATGAQGVAGVTGAQGAQGKNRYI